MAGDVREGFLHDPVGRGLHLGREASLDPFVLELDLDTGLVGESLEEREQGGQQPELIEHGGTQVERETADPAEQVVDDAAGLLQPGVHRGRWLIAPRFEQQLEARQQLAELVVELASQAPALGLLDLEQLPG